MRITAGHAKYKTQSESGCVRTGVTLLQQTEHLFCDHFSGSPCGFGIECKQPLARNFNVVVATEQTTRYKLTILRVLSHAVVPKTRSETFSWGG